MRSNGDGTFEQVYYSNGGIAGYNLTTDRDRALPFDYNGDGKSDLFLYRPDSGNAYVARSLGDGNYEEVYDSGSGIANYNLNSERDQAFSFDFNGNGKSDIFLFRPNSGICGIAQPGTEYPDLLSKIDNGFFGTTEIEYTKSSDYPNTKLNFIFHPVSKITTNDGFGNLPSRIISYKGGYYDSLTREFRGFETVTQTNAEGTQYEVMSATKFHQDEYRKGRQQWTGLWPIGSDPELDTAFTKATFSWSTEPSNPLQGAWAFIKLDQKLTQSFDSVTVTAQEDYVYNNTNGNLTSKTTSGTDAENVTISYQYLNLGTWLWRIEQETVEGSISGKVRETYYDYYPNGTGNLQFKEFWLDGEPTNPKIEITYFTDGNQKTIIDENDNITKIFYDTTTYTYPRKIEYPETNGVSHIVENEEWDYRFGKVEITKDENGNRTYYDYDEFGRPVQVDSPNGGQVTTEYNDDVFPRYVVTKVKEDASGNTINSYKYFDGLGREIQSISLGEAGKAIVTLLFYDALGRNDLVEGPFFETSRNYVTYPPDDGDYPLNPVGLYPWQQTSFDLRGRPETIESADGEYVSVFTEFSYSGFSTTIEDDDEASKTETKDYLGRIIEVIEHDDGADYSTTYTYNAAGDLLTVNDHYSNTTTINYDTLGRKINMTDPDMGYWEYTYYPNGNLHTQIDAKNQTITFNYDELNRVTSKTYSTSDPTVIYTYDNTTLQKNGIGRLYTVSNTQVTTTYNAYDEMGNVKSVSKTITGDATEYITQYEYDFAGRVTKTIYPDSYEVSNAFYAGTGLLEKVTGSDSVQYAKLTNYEPTGKIGQIEHANNIITTYSYDPESTRLTSVVTAKAGPYNDLQNKTYLYTKAGDIKEITDDVNSITYNYTYDKLHRLTGETNTGSYYPLSYTYNAIGNIMSKTAGPHVTTYTYHNSHKHAVRKRIKNGYTRWFNYDGNGNMIKGWDDSNPTQAVERQIDYNADNMPIQIRHLRSSGTVTTDYIYDGDGVRSKKSIQGGSTTYYIGAHFEIKDSATTKFIFAGNLRVAIVTGSGVNYFHKDHLGSSTVMTDASGEEVEATEYWPFGNQRNHNGAEVSDYKFTDQELDAESGLYNYNARLYDPVLGRFISPDTIVQDPYDPQTLNRYSYARNNPLIYTDPSGHIFGIDNLIGAVVGAVIGGVTSAVTGGDVWEGVVTGAITGALFAYAPGISDALGIASPLGEAGVHAGIGAASGGINNAITGGDVGLGVLTGGISGGFGKYFGQFLEGYDYPFQLAGRSLIGGVTGGISAEIYGADFTDGFVNGVKTAAIGLICNDTIHRSPEILRLLVPGQVAWDNARTAWSHGNYVSAGLHTAEMLAEQVLTALTLGQSKAIQQSAYNANRYIKNNWFRYDPSGKWRTGGKWQSGKHVHIDPIPGSNRLMQHHLPHQRKTWWGHFKAIIRGR